MYANLGKQITHTFADDTDKLVFINDPVNTGNSRRIQFFSLRQIVIMSHKCSLEHLCFSSLELGALVFLPSLDDEHDENLGAIRLCPSEACGGEIMAREMMLCSGLICREVVRLKRHVGLSAGLSLESLRKIKVQRRERCVILLYGNVYTDRHALSVYSNCAL